MHCHIEACEELAVAAVRTTQHVDQTYSTKIKWAPEAAARRDTVLCQVHLPQLITNVAELMA